MSHITIKDLSYNYLTRGEETPALEHISLAIGDGEVVGLTGTSGSGKSTLLQILSGNLKGYSGEVTINGSAPDPKRHSIALVPQNYVLLPWKKVLQNILLPHTLGKECPRIGELGKIVEWLKIAHLLHRYPSQLSGGQKQRVALARAFVQSPDLLLMDEPFSALDIITSERSKEIFRVIQKELRLTTIIVSHNLQELQGLTDRVILMGGSPGHLLLDTCSPSRQLLIEQLQSQEMPK